MFIRKNVMTTIKNTTMASYDELLSQKRNLENMMANLQREKDLKVDRINNKYEAEIEQVLRALNVLDNEIDKAKMYVNDNITTTSKRRQ